jgi:DNA-binding GntR family transcriptional regulator
MGPMTPIPSSRIAQELREQIASGQLPQGARLPSQRELSEQYDVGRDTVRAALDELVGEGLLELRRPLGTFVRERHLEPYLPGRTVSPRLAAWLEQLAVTGQDRSEDARVAVVPCPAAVGEQLGVPVNGGVLCRTSVLYVNHEPHQAVAVYVPLEVVVDRLTIDPSGLPLLPRDFDEWTAVNLAPVRAVDLWTVRMPSPDERGRLRLPPSGAPVAVHTCVEHEDGRAVRCTVAVLPGDRHVIVYERLVGPAQGL